MTGDTIAAQATARGRGAIGIIKISGPQAASVAGRIFRTGECPAGGGHWPAGSHRLHYGWVCDPSDGRPIDEVLVSYMAGPRSYTGEDVVEINSHGGPAVVERIFDAVRNAGARLAEPGEFTRRAFLNGRIDLTQAEAVADLIEARSRVAADAAARRLGGGMGERLGTLRQRLIGCRASVETEIDFAAEVPTESVRSICSELESAVMRPLAEMIEQHRLQRPFCEGVRLAVVGRPNAGKSSLVNRLVSQDRVIVSDTPGTTRDLVDVEARVGQIDVVITDTAGMHDESSDPIEQMGMEKTIGCIGRADLVLFLIDGEKGFGREEERIREALGRKSVIVVYNKMDRVTGDAQAAPSGWPDWPMVGVSAKFDERFEGLEAALIEALDAGGALDGDAVVPNLRQVERLQAAHGRLETAMVAMAEERFELAAIDIDAALDEMDRMLGRRSDEALLDEVFRRFCIGK